MFAWGLRFSMEFRYNLVADSGFPPETLPAIPSSKVRGISAGARERVTYDRSRAIPCKD
jgi:hypothetical protein